MTLHADLTDERRIKVHPSGAIYYPAKDEHGGKWWLARKGEACGYARSVDGAVTIVNGEKP